MPTTAGADNAPHSYLLVMEEPNFGVAANGDQIATTGEGEFSVNPNSVDAAGEFTHPDANGNVRASETWTANELLTYQSYGCGEVFGTPFPSNLCGGAVKMRVTLSTPEGSLPAIMTVICVIGTHAPQAILGPRSEGVTLNVQDVETGSVSIREGQTRGT